MDITAIIQARMSSHRLPGKVMKEVDGKPLLLFLIERVNRCVMLKNIVVATSDTMKDDAIAEFCQDLGFPCFRGPLKDVAGRFYATLNKYPSSAFVRINADSPLLDPIIIDKAVSKYQSGTYDLVTNVFPRTFPSGQSVEVIRTSVFKDTIFRFSLPLEREHITSYFYNHPDQFTIFNISSDNDYSDYHFSIDTPDDWNWFCSIISRMDKEHWYYHLHDLINMTKGTNHG